MDQFLRGRVRLGVSLTKDLAMNLCMTDLLPSCYYLQKSGRLCLYVHKYVAASKKGKLHVKSQCPILIMKTQVPKYIINSIIHNFIHIFQYPVMSIFFKSLQSNK